MTSGPDDLYPPYEELEVEDPASVDSLLEDGSECFESGDIEGAVRAWREALAIDPNNAAAIAGLGSAGVTPLAASPRLIVAAPPPFEPEPARHSVFRRSGPMPVITGTIATEGAEAPSVIVANVAPAASGGGWRRLLVAGLLILLLSLIAVITLDGRSDQGANDAARPPIAASADESESAPTAASAPASPERGHFDAKIVTTPPTASVYIDGEAVGSGAALVRFPKNGRRHTLRIEAPGFKVYEASFVDVAPEETVTLERIAGVAIEPRRPRRATKRARGPASAVLGAPDKANAKQSVDGAPSFPAAPEVEPPKPVKPRPALPLTDNKDPWAE